MRVEVDGLRFTYGDEGFRLDVPRFTTASGSTTALVGPSGCGKTTLLHLMAGILAPHEGSIRVGETRVSELSPAAARAFRLARIGLVFQEFELLDYLSVLDNILLPLHLGGDADAHDARGRAASLARDVGLGDKLGRRPRHLSQGERQRVAICRALLLGPGLVLADEPTGNLDGRNKERVLDVLIGLTATSGATLIAVTHDTSLLDRFEQVHDAAAGFAPVVSQGGQPS